ncbi:hypothetical protein Hamer_G008710 [Homarus americanus]|uniref:Uncharacterized protein n=1 Tax=Homarus americanus TaxID=6706 RepID=A0A8J5N4B0_HOMAM|nr:hypothetical protein Hamer_G008710 [Homarus americanus]
MPCRVDATCVKALLLALVTLTACITPATSQIHWNRGWGAGGSMGKRSSSAAASSTSPIEGGPAGDNESEVSRMATCEVRGRSVGSSTMMTGEQDQLARYPFWMAMRKAPTTDQ